MPNPKHKPVTAADRAFAEALFAARVAAELMPAQLAERAGLNPVTIGHIEATVRPATPAEREALAGVLDMDGAADA